MLVFARRGATLSVLLALLSSACSDSSSSRSAARVVATPVDPATAGTIQVEVRFDGTAPAPKELVMRSAPQCAAAHSGPVYDRSLLIDNGHLLNAIVWIKQGLENWTFAPPGDAVRIDQSGCLYEPHVATVMVGQAVEFRNSDPEAHNVHGKPSAQSGWNFMMSRQGATRTLTFDKPEVAMPIACDIHPWMSGFLGVVTNPYAGVSAKDGTVTLRNVPPGAYTLGVWHEKLGTREEKVTLSPHGEAKVVVTFAAK